MLAPAGRHVRSRPSRPQRRRGRLAERLIEDGEAAVDLLLRRGQRRCQADGAEPRRLGGNEIESERSEEHTSELQSLMRISYAVFCLKKKKIKLFNSLFSIKLLLINKL